MKRFTEKPFFQKLKKERRHERTTTTRTTTTTEYKKFSSRHREEFSSSSEQHEEQFYGENENGKPKSLRFTQSLQDAFHPNLMDDHQQHLLQLSNEFPPLQREPRQYQPRNIREEQKEFSEQFEDDKFVRTHQQKLFEFREQFNLNGENGGGQCQPQKKTLGEGDEAVPATQPKEGEEQQQQQRQYSRMMAMKRTSERQQQFVERKWQHSSMPPLERLRLLQAQQQMPHELVLDRFPPQLVQSVHQLADAVERRYDRSANSRGFSPFPVFGPFITDSISGGSGATMAPQSRQKSVPPQATYNGTKPWAMAPPKEEMSVSMTTSQHRMPIFDKLPKQQQEQSTHFLPPPMTSSSGDEWQSAYECLPQWTKQMPKMPPETAPKPQQDLSSSFPSFCAAPFAESVQCSVNLCKFHAYSRQLAAKSIWPMSDSQAEMFQSVVSVEGNQRIRPTLNESATFSEHQANDEVRNLMGASGTVSPPAQMHTSPETQNRQLVRVEFSGPVNFLHATNLNVTNNRNIYNSMSESGEKKNEMGDNRSERRDKMTISPPVERYIDSVCDLGPIFTEIGQSLRAQNHQPSFVLTPTGNIRRAEQQQQKREVAENSEENAEAPEKNEAFVGLIDNNIEQQQNTTSGRKASLQHINVPYLVHSSSQCNFSRVSDVTQEWRLARVPSEESVEFAAMVTVRSQTCRVTEAFSGTFNSANKMPISRLQTVPRRPSVDNFCYSSASASQNAIENNATASLRTKSQPSRYGPTPSMHRTQSADRAALETAQWRRRQDDAQNALRDTLTDVQREQAAARAYSKRFHCAEAERIERAILAISEGLRRPMEPVSKAQAEAKEELLRVRLAQLILNLDPDNNNSTYKDEDVQFQQQYGPEPFWPPATEKRVLSDVAVSYRYREALREPIALLRQKLRLLENRLLHEDADCIGTELRRISATPPPLRSEQQRRRHEALCVRSGEIARMTPLIGMLQHKLSTLDDACTRREEQAEQEQHQQQLNHRGERGTERRLTPYAERKTVHELLKRISGEIETIHELCRRDEVRDRLDAVLAVLKRVASSVDQITTTLDGIGRNDQQQQRRNVHGEERQQRKRGIMGQREGNSAPIEERRNSATDSESQKRLSPSKLEQAIKHRQEAGGGGEALARKEHKRRTEQLMREMVDTFRQREKRWQWQMDTNIGTMTTDDNSFDEHGHHQRMLLSTNQQWVHAVELSANFVRHPSAVAQRVNAIVFIAGDEPHYAGTAHPAHFQQCAMDLHAMHPMENGGDESISSFLSAEKGTGGKDRAYDRMKKRRFDQQTPRIVRQPNMPNILQYDEDEHISAFKLGACPPSYLPRDEMPKTHTQHPFQYQLEVPSRVHQPKFLQLHQQHYYLCSSQDEEEEEDEMTASSASALDSSSLNVPIFFRKKLSICSEPTRETAILTDEEESPEENINEVFFLRRRRKHAMLNAIIYPETKSCLRASLRHGNNFEVVVERMSDCGRDSVVMVSEEFYDKRVLIRSGSPVRHSTIMEEMESSDEGRPSASSPGTMVDAHTKMAVSISARSDRDSVHVFLEEIPCGQIGAQVKAPSASPCPSMASTHFHANGAEMAGRKSAQSVGMANSAEWRDCVFREIRVSGGADLVESSSRSLRSSRRPSQKSLLVVSEGADETEDIPAYVIKKGSTASITCELNSDCVGPDSKIEWFRGQNEQIVPFGDKFERIRDGWVELLVISDVQLEDGQLYSVKINGELYPVAYLIVEELHDNDDMEGSTPSGQTVVGIMPEPQFLTAPQTQFVLQGETAILSVQMNRADLDVIWHKDGQILGAHSGGQCADGRPRIWQEGTTTGWYRIIVNDIQFSDQGYYFAQFGEQQTNVQLIVEERIDEREVQVSSAETDDEELGDYLVPFGSTATIACELENVSFGYKLHWQRNHRDLDYEISSGDGKFEHVVNRAKHYLIIHNAQPEDSGVYSVRIGDTMFKVAQISIGTELGQQNLSGSRIRRISSQSLNQSNERDARQNAKRKEKTLPK